MGIGIKGGTVSRLIKKNTTIPFKITKCFVTSEDNQTGINLPIYEGERLIAIDNHHLGSISLEGITIAPKGTYSFDVTFDINADGLMKVTAIDNKTKQKKEIEVETRSLSQE